MSKYLFICEVYHSECMKRAFHVVISLNLEKICFIRMCLYLDMKLTNLRHEILVMSHSSNVEDSYNVANTVRLFASVSFDVVNLSHMLLPAG